MSIVEPNSLAAIKSQQGELFFVSRNPSAEETVILLHGAFSSNLEWEYVAPYLKDFHLLIADLPQHSGSRDFKPFTLALAGEKVATLIKNHGHGGKAHVVGLSLGGFVTQELIRKNPDVVISAFITGCTPFTPTQQWLAARDNVISWGLWLTHATGLYRFAAWKAGLLPHDMLKKQMAENNRNGVAKSVYPSLAQYSWDDVEEAAKQGKRVAVCAGELQDDVPGAKRLGESFRRGGLGLSGANGDQSQAFVVKKAGHGWDLQFPELFARAVIAWIRLEALPPGLESLRCLEGGDVELQS